MQGYVAKILENGNYLESFHDDWEWDYLHLRGTEKIEKAMFFTEEDKNYLESTIIGYSDDEVNDRVKFVKCKRTTSITVDSNCIYYDKNYTCIG